MPRKPGPTLRRRELGPTVQRRLLGARLRDLRLQKDLTLEEVATRMMVSSAKISRLEAGARPASLRDVRELCVIYEAGAEEREQLMQLARQSRERSWWQEYGLPAHAFMGLEAAATSILDFKSGLVPGLLQTEDYARLMIESGLLDPEPAVVERIVEARHQRQRLLSGEQPVRFYGILDEAVVRRVVGGPTVMRDQVRSLVELAAQPNIEIRLLTFEAGAHPAMDSNFTIFEFAEDVPDVVYVEGLLGDHYLESPADLTRYRQVFDRLGALALPATASAAELLAVVRGYDAQDGAEPSGPS